MSKRKTAGMVFLSVRLFSGGRATESSRWMRPAVKEEWAGATMVVGGDAERVAIYERDVPGLRANGKWLRVR